MLHLICQWLMVVSTVCSLFINLYWDVNGRPAQMPGGFQGVVSTLIGIALVVLIEWGAGVYSSLPAGP